MTEGVDAPQVTVVIRCFNEVDHIGHLLSSLQDQTITDFEVVVVDSGSRDGTVELVQQHDVRLLHIEPDRFTFGRSLNLGCSAARGEFLVFVSAHCYPTDEHWLKHLLEGFADPRVGAVYGRQHGTPHSHFAEQRIFSRWYPDASVEHQADPFLNNANCAIRRKLWETFPYDEELPGLEDVEWATRVMRDGWRINYSAEAAVVHVHEESPAQIRRRYQREAITFQHVFPREHFNLFDLVRLITKNVLGDWRSARAEGAFLRNAWPIFRFRLAQFVGTYQGFHTRWPGSSDLKRRFYYPEGR